MFELHYWPGSWVFDPHPLSYSNPMIHSLYLTWVRSWVLFEVVLMAKILGL
jgi:hypothetical protein